MLGGTEFHREMKKNVRGSVQAAWFLLVIIYILVFTIKVFHKKSSSNVLFIKILHGH